MGERCGKTTRSGKRRANGEGHGQGEDPVFIARFLSLSSSLLSFLFGRRVISEGNLSIGLLSLRPGFLLLLVLLWSLNSTGVSWRVLSQGRARIRN